MKIKKLRMANSLLADILACNGFHAQGYATLKSDAPDDLKVIDVFHSDADGTTFIVESESFADVEFIHDAPLIVFSITAENYVENLREELEAVVADRDDLLKRAELVAGWNEITTGLGKTVKEMKEYIDTVTAERGALQAQLDEEKRKRNATNMIAANMKAEWDAMREERDKLQALVKELENPDLVATIAPLRKLFAEYFDSMADLTRGSHIKGDDK